MGKRLLSLILSVVLIFSLTGCGEEGGTNGSTSGQESPDTQKEYEIAIVPKDTVNVWFQVIADGGAAYGKENGVNVYMKGGNAADAALQIEIIEDLIASDVDALCVIPNDISALESVLQKARDAGIVVICHEASTQGAAQYDIEAFDNSQFGATIMDSLASVMGEEGQYCVMVGSLTNGSHNEWADGGIAQQEAKYPNMELVGERIEINDDSEVAYEKAKEMLKTYPDLKGFFGTAAQAVPGVARAIEELGLADQVFISGMALPQAVSEYIKNGTVKSIVLWDPYDVGYAMASLAHKLLNGEEITDGVNLGVKGYENMTLVNEKVLLGAGWLEVSKENVDDFSF